MSPSDNQKLNLAPNLSDPDAFYEALIDAHQDLSADQSNMLNAQLILLLSNHIGSLPVLREAFAIARADATPVGSGVNS
ncbi:DUF2783 domain-containing protein [Duganella sp. FT92W]|uniref:DUF2783 domain-containing protein n=1 Tax=Pseudoduganella rivuli TaxID=2666085 RepID=A0A7X2IL12_9BURK|nr:DUF2783 domain-containing protein [Pseudoduganella rivuli]MRV71784.1 DUF2783 domain-containing protein [Pseudoduganella rivuli]